MTFRRAGASTGRQPPYQLQDRGMAGQEDCTRQAAGGCGGGGLDSARAQGSGCERLQQLLGDGVRLRVDARVQRPQSGLCRSEPAQAMRGGGWCI